MDRDSVREQLNAQSLSPLHFLNDTSRDQFWKLLDSCRDTLEARTYGNKNGSGPAQGDSIRSGEL